MQRQTVIFKDLGLMDYKSAWDEQEKLLNDNTKLKTSMQSSDFSGKEKESESGEGHSFNNNRKEKETSHYLLFVEHPPVYTLGKSGKMEHVLINENERRTNGIDFYNTNRGGDITFHGPQQIVGYPILDLEKFYKDIGRYLRSLEEVIILTMSTYGLKGERSTGETGVWIEPGTIGRARKICAMGVRCSRWITMHGFAFNVNTDLSYFDFIIPCGIQHKQVTSMQKELGHSLDMEEVKKEVRKNFERVFDVELLPGE